MQTPVVFLEKAFLTDVVDILTTRHDITKNWEFLDFYGFLTKGIAECNLVIDFQDQAELESFIIANSIFNEIFQKVNQYFLLGNFRSFFLESKEKVKDIQSPFILFFVTWDDAECKKYREETGFLFFNINSIRKEWMDYSLYNNKREKYISGKCKENSMKFTKWKDISFVKQPLNAILLQDLYLFKHGASVEDNFKPIIEALFYSKKLTKGDILLIYANSDYKEVKDLYDILRKNIIKGIVSDSTTRKEASSLMRENIKFSLLEYFYGSIAKESDFIELHDRFIITNNLFIYSPFGFDLLNDKKTIRSSYISADFIFYENVFNRACSYVDNIRLYISGCLTDQMCYPQEQERITSHPFFQ